MKNIDFTKFILNNTKNIAAHVKSIENCVYGNNSSFITRSYNKRNMLFADTFSKNNNYNLYLNNEILTFKTNRYKARVERFKIILYLSKKRGKEGSGDDLLTFVFGNEYDKKHADKKNVQRKEHLAGFKLIRKRIKEINDACRNKSICSPIIELIADLSYIMKANYSKRPFQTTV